MTFRAKLRQFAEETPFHGLAFILTFDSKPIKIFWLCAFIAAVGLFIHDLVKLVDYYRTEPTAFSVDVETNREKNFRTPTLCAEFYINDAFKNFTPVETPEILNFLKVTSYANKLDFTDWQKMNLSSSLEFGSYLVLGHLTDAELLLLNQKREWFTDFATNASFDVLKENKVSSAALQKIYKTYLQNNISLANLKRLIGSAICQKLFATFQTYRYFGDPNSTQLPLCEPDMITHLSFTLVCSKLFKTEAVQLIDQTYNYFSISLTRTSANLEPYDENLIFDKIVTLSWHLDFEGRPILPLDERKNIFSWNPQKSVKVDVWAEEEYQFFSKTSSPCITSDESEMDYEWRQAAEQMFDSCGCWPATLFHLKNSHNKRLCFHDSANVTVKGIEGNYTGRICNASQLPIIQPRPKECVFLSYKFSLPKPPFSTWQKLIYKHRQPYGQLELGFQYQTDRIVSVESLAKSWENFMWEFGGTVGSWLGGSILAFIHVLLFILDPIIRRCRK